jgi:hypothetical protein
LANTRNGNTWYVDTQHSASSDSLAVKGIRVLGVVVTATAANGRIVLSDEQGTPPTKLDLRVATSGDSKHFDFCESPVAFPNGIRPVTLTNAVVTVIIEEARG